MTDRNDPALAAVCGLYCGDCEYAGDKCGGCTNIEGKPFWVSQFGLATCPIYNCSVNKHEIEHCGLCDEFPCEMFKTLRDPSQSDEEAERALIEKRSSLLLRKEIGTEAWVEYLFGQ